MDAHRASVYQHELTRNSNVRNGHPVFLLEVSLSSLGLFRAVSIRDLDGIILNYSITLFQLKHHAGVK